MQTLNLPSNGYPLKGELGPLPKKVSFLWNLLSHLIIRAHARTQYLYIRLIFLNFARFFGFFETQLIRAILTNRTFCLTKSPKIEK